VGSRTSCGPSASCLFCRPPNTWCRTTLAEFPGFSCGPWVANSFGSKINSRDRLLLGDRKVVDADVHASIDWSCRSGAALS
jgi:hypothetical protein